MDCDSTLIKSRYNFKKTVFKILIEYSFGSSSLNSVLLNPSRAQSCTLLSFMRTEMTSDTSNYHRKHSHCQYSLFQFEGSDVMYVLRNSVEYSFLFFKCLLRGQLIRSAFVPMRCFSGPTQMILDPLNRCKLCWPLLTGSIWLRVPKWSRTDATCHQPARAFYQLLAFSLEFLSGGGKIYCYANFYCYSIVFGPNFRDGQKFSRGANCLRGEPPCPPWEKARAQRSISLIYKNVLSVQGAPPQSI